MVLENVLITKWYRAMEMEGKNSNKIENERNQIKPIWRERTTFEGNIFVLRILLANSALQKIALRDFHFKKLDV
jgi:hypothetical protein